MITSNLHYINVYNLYADEIYPTDIEFQDWLKSHNAALSTDYGSWIMFDTEEDYLAFKLKYVVPEVLIYE